MRSREEIEKELQKLLDQYSEHAESIKLSVLIEIALDIRELLINAPNFKEFIVSLKKTIKKEKQ